MKGKEGKRGMEGGKVRKKGGEGRSMEGNGEGKGEREGILVEEGRVLPKNKKE